MRSRNIGINNYLLFLLSVMNLNDCVGLYAVRERHCESEVSCPRTDNTITPARVRARIAQTRTV